MIFLRYILLILVGYIATILLTSYLFFNNIINTNIDMFKTKVNNQLKIFELTIKKPLLDHNEDKIFSLIEQFANKSFIKSITLKYDNYYITKGNLVLHSNDIKTLDWLLLDISIDFSYGVLSRFGDSDYIFIPDDDFDFKKPIVIKYQASKEDRLINTFSTITFDLPKKIDNPTPIKIGYQNFIYDFIKNKFIDIKIDDITHQLYIDSGKVHSFAVVKYNLNYNNIYNNIFKELNKYYTLITILYIFVLFLLIGINYYIYNITIIKKIKKINIFVKDLISNKFFTYKDSSLNNRYLKQLVENLNNLSKKTSNLVSELSVSRNMLELQVSSDKLTNLPNYKVFEHKLKQLFVISDIQAYISLVKLEILPKFSSQNSQIITDKLILQFVKSIKSIIDMIDSKNITLFRFYGSEFAIIYQNCDFTKQEQFAQKVLNLVSTLHSEFNIDKSEDIVKIVSIPFKQYSTTDGIVKQLNELYKQHKNEKYFIEDNEKIKEEEQKLENLIISIIKNNAFNLDFKLNTYLLSDMSKTILKEVAPILIDYDGNNIPIGTFVSVAENKNIAGEFDKNVIEKSFKYIKQKKPDFLLAINISITSFKSEEFKTWIETKLLYEYKDLVDKFVFSITSFAAKNNFDEFKSFCDMVDRFGSGVLLKRFNYNDIKLDKLESVKLQYIRIHKDYTKDIDKSKMLILNNIASFCDIQGIKLLADSVSDKDFTVIKNINFYGLSKE